MCVAYAGMAKVGLQLWKSEFILILLLYISDFIMYLYYNCKPPLVHPVFDRNFNWRMAWFIVCALEDNTAAVYTMNLEEKTDTGRPSRSYFQLPTGRDLLSYFSFSLLFLAAITTGNIKVLQYTPKQHVFPPISFFL